MLKLPFWCGKVVNHHMVGFALRGRGKEHGVCGDGAGGDILYCGGCTYLRITEPEQCFFVPEVDFDVPAPKVVLDYLGELGFGVSADEVSGLSVEQLSVFGEPVGGGRDDDQLEVVVLSCGAPT